VVRLHTRHSAPRRRFDTNPPRSGGSSAASGPPQSSMYREQDPCDPGDMTDAGAPQAALTLSKGRAEDLFRRHCAEAVRLAYLLTGDVHLAEDLTQDAFVRSFGRFQDLRRPEAFASYLRRTIVNLSRDHFRRLQSERAHSDRERRLEANEDPSLGRVDARDELLHALQALPSRQRAAVVLRHCEGLPEQKVADALGTSVGAVNSLVSRGLTALRERMRGEDGE
jgi:RNA polymerase sigma-70 factor (sigma-E family)